MNRNLQHLLLCIAMLAIAAAGGAVAQGGNCGLFNFISETREYPYEAYEKKIEGRVFCTFIVNADGSVGGISIVRGSGNEQLNREALRVISMMPKWQAGKQAGKQVAVRCYLPITFHL